MLHLVPGDPARTMLGVHATPEGVAQLHKQWGLDKPLWQQYTDYLGRLMHGDLGTSLFYRLDVSTLIRERLGPTLWLLLFAAVMSRTDRGAAGSSCGQPTGRRPRPGGAVRAHVRAGHAAASGSGIILLIVFALHLGRHFPVGGYGHSFTEHMHSMILPALTVALFISPILIRSLRASLLDVLQADYITTARAKGISERRVMVRHAVRNGIISMVTVLGLNIAYLVGGTLVVEQVFALPGIGALMINVDLPARLHGGAGDRAGVRGAGGADQPAHRYRRLVARPAREVRVVGQRSRVRRRAPVTNGLVGSRSRWYRTPSFVAGVLILGTLIGLALAAPMGDPLLAHRPGPAQHPQGALVGALAGHRPARPRRLVAAGVRRPRRSQGRVPGGAAAVPDRHRAGQPGRLYGGKLDTLVGYFVNVVVAFPFYVLIIAILFALGPGERSIYIAITFVGWVSYTRIIRAEILVAKRREYVEAARVAGSARFPHHRPPPVAERDHAGDDLRDVGHRALASLRSSRSATSASASSLRRPTGAP